MKNKPKYSACIGFWIILGVKKESFLLVCPALIKDKAVDDIKKVSIDKAWNVAVQAPDNVPEKNIMLMIPQISNFASDMKITKTTNLLEIKEIREKCIALGKEYAERMNSLSK